MDGSAPNAFLLRSSLANVAMNGTLDCLREHTLYDEGAFMFTSESVGEGHPGKEDAPLRRAGSTRRTPACLLLHLQGLAASYHAKPGCWLPPPPHPSPPTPGWQQGFRL